MEEDRRAGEEGVGAQRGWELENRGRRGVGGRRTMIGKWNSQVEGTRENYKKYAQYCAMLKSRTRGGNHQGRGEN